MTSEVTRLKNGLRVVSHHMPHVETVSLGVWVAAGARHERQTEHGISHLLEHMAFKGTERRSASDIAEEIEAVGGELNAATSLETTAYFARIRSVINRATRADAGKEAALSADADRTAPSKTAATPEMPTTWFKRPPYVRSVRSEVFPAATPGPGS